MLLQGSIVALVTPMYEGVAPDTPLDEEALAGLIEFHVEQGSSAILVAGTTGECATLRHEEHCHLIRLAVKLTAGRLPVIAGTGANSTLEAIDLTRCACEAGADACLLVTPYYNKPTQEGLYLHYRAITEAVETPLLLYNVPSRTACDLLPETVARLAELPGYIGIKEASNQLDRVAQLRRLCGPDFLLLSGEDGTAREFMQRGGTGVISVSANIAPAAMQRLCVQIMAGDAAGAEAADRGLQRLHRALFIESNPIPVKWVLHRMGRIQAGIRMPLNWLAESCRQEVLAVMNEAGIC